VEQEKLKNIVEAALLAAHQPLTLPMLAALFQDSDAVSHEDLARAIEALGQACEGRGIELQEVASGFRYQVREDVHPWVSRLWAERQTKYSRALLETLALIAYRQPITRGEIEQVRGVAVATSIMRTLEEREWVRVVGYRDVPGKPALFGTTRQFLDYFNLKSLDQLPTLAEIREIADPDPQLALASTQDDAGNPPDAPSDPSQATDGPAGAGAPADAPRTTEDAA
jgi:segregation and condensation protein B